MLETSNSTSIILPPFFEIRGREHYIFLAVLTAVREFASFPIYFIQNGMVPGFCSTAQFIYSLESIHLESAALSLVDFLSTMHSEIAVLTAHNTQDYRLQTLNLLTAAHLQGPWHPISSETLNRRSKMSNTKSVCRLPVGIDPSRDTLGVCFLHPNEDVVLEQLMLENRSFHDSQKLLSRATNLAKRFQTEPVFVIEATNVFWRPLASWLKSQGAQVHVVSSRQTHANRSTGMRKTKTDFIDAALIARLYKQGKSAEPYLPKEPYMSLRELSRLNAFLVDLKGKIHSRVYGLLYQMHPLWDKAFCHPFTKASLELMRREWVHPAKLALAPDEELSEVLDQTSHGHKGHVFAQSLKALSKQVFHVHEGADGFSFALKCLSDVIVAMDTVLDELELRLARYLKDLSVDLLQTVPGMSVKTSASFIGELGDHHRFSSADKVVAWFGYDPAIGQSGLDDGQHRTLSKSGTKYGRRTMFLVTLSFIRAVPQARKKFHQLLRAGRKKREAICIMAADLIKTCYAMLKSKSEFDPKKV
jgi:transposase